MKKYTYQELVEHCKDSEDIQLELKNSAFLLLEHPGNSNGIEPAKTIPELKNKLTQMLSKECSGLANATGGMLVIGFNNSGTLDNCSVPAKWGTSNTKIDKFVEDILASNIFPAINGISVDLIESSDDREKRLLLIDVPKAYRPHQANDKRYYIRRSKEKVEALFDWEIDDIRNRAIHPKLEIEYQSTNPYSVLGTYLNNDRKIFPKFCFNTIITNTGNKLAKEWAVLIKPPFGTVSEVQPSELYSCQLLRRDDLKQSNSTFYCNKSLYPLQSISFTINLHTEVKLIMNDGKPSDFQWLELSRGLDQDADYNIECTIYADNADPKIVNLDFSKSVFESMLIGCYRGLDEQLKSFRKDF
ncbi:MAG TPA: ATP-binding protein [Oligoflexia bacterium]|nr:ATP-binding protein [Oligoflexia bacterium]HMP47312.1 ATP-binding protein [Oligoflexia bacterium]